MAQRPDPHSHRCCHCGLVWSHDRARITEGAVDRAHQCPTCATPQFFRHQGDEPPTVFNHGEEKGQGLASTTAVALFTILFLHTTAAALALVVFR